jgi:hypothetical protein
MCRRGGAAPAEIFGGNFSAENIGGPAVPCLLFSCSIAARFRLGLAAPLAIPYGHD